MSYAELHCLSNFTFLQGASHPQELVQQAHALGYRALAITDECSLAGVVRAHVAAREIVDFKFIIGSEFRLEEGTTVIALVTNRDAYSELASLITLARRRSPKGQYRLGLNELGTNLPSCLLIWKPGLDDRANDDHARMLSGAFPGRLWLGVSQLLRGDEPERIAACQALAERWRIPLLACGDVRMHVAEREPLQDALTAIRHNTAVDRLGYRREGNAERHLRPLPRLQSLYPAAWLKESLRIAERCHFSLNELKYDYPPEVVPAGMTPASWLRHLVEQGVQKRWPQGVPASVRQTIDTELGLIAQKRYEYYFLTVYDIVQFARAHDILCQGRGSAANSVVCYCLFITEVSPERANLLFERFISPEREEPPDIDVDFEHERREEVIQHIYKKYTRERAALVATVISYRPRSAIRDIGKALGLDPLFVEQLTKSLAWWDRKNELIDRFRAQGLGGAPLAEHFFSLVQQLLGFPRHLSQHVGGFLISKSPISTLVPVENASMPERTVIQWDKDDIEELQLLKVDVLALGMLTAIHKCLKLIEQHHDRPLLMRDISPGDEATYDMLCEADSVGVFQVESRAQMVMLPRLKPRTYYDLVVQVALVRPGPIQGDMVHPYLRNRREQRVIEYPSEEIKAVLERTYGVPIFQEQVIKLAMVAADFSAGEADRLRRSMASWGKNGSLSQFEQKLIDGMKKKGLSAEFAQRLFQQMQGFGAYGFPESHAASFALLVYVSAWLKCHYPAAFYCALLNSQPMGFYSSSQLVQDARRHRIEVRPLDVRHSEWDFTLEAVSEGRPALRLGLRLIKGLGRAGADRLQQCRTERSFTDIADLQRRTGLDTEQLGRLIAADALRGLSGHRHQARWQALAIPAATAIEGERVMDYDDQVELRAPSEIEAIRADYNTTNLTLGRHPLALLRERLPEFRRCKTQRDLLSLNQGRFVQIAGVVTGRQRPGTTSGVVFLTLEDETGNINVVVWRDVQERCRQALLEGKLLMVKGVIEREEKVVHVIAGQLIDASSLLPDMALTSRDFHYETLKCIKSLKRSSGKARPNKYLFVVPGQAGTQRSWLPAYTRKAEFQKLQKL